MANARWTRKLPFAESDIYGGIYGLDVWWCHNCMRSVGLNSIVKQWGWRKWGKIFARAKVQGNKWRRETNAEIKKLCGKPVIS